jgi:hypothetical protein
LEVPKSMAAKPGAVDAAGAVEREFMKVAEAGSAAQRSEFEGAAILSMRLPVAGRRELPHVDPPVRCVARCRQA